MSNRYVVVYRPEIAAEDFPHIPQNVRARIIRAIETRLMTEPTRYGERLRRSLIGLWKIRVGDYRVCYDVEGRAVTVWAIRHRRDIYSILERRRPA